MTAGTDSLNERKALPLVLVVEDDGPARALRSDSLREAGCEVIPADSTDTALMVLRDGPSVDLIVTDIHLGEGTEARGGIRLARTVKQNYDSDLPLAAYSGIFGESDISADDRSLFVATQPRGRMSIKQQQIFYRECHQHALRHKLTRLQRSVQAAASSDLRDIQGRSLHAKEFVFATDLDEVEAVLDRLSYELRLVSSDRFRELASPLAVWVRARTDGVEAQVCGQPLLHWEGSTEEEALAGIIALMEGFAEDFRKSTADPIGPAERLREFLNGMIVGGAERGIKDGI